MKAPVRAAICLLIASLHARGDLVVVSKVETKEMVLTVTMKIKGDKVRTAAVTSC